MCKVSHFRLYILSISERFSEKMGRHAHTQMCAHTHTHFVTCGFISKGKLVKKKEFKKATFFLVIKMTCEIIKNTELS